MRKDKAMKKNLLKHSAIENGVCNYDSDLPGRKAGKRRSGDQGFELAAAASSRGQIRGLQRMVEEDRYCADILTQVSFAQEALRAVARALMRNHLSHCAAYAIRTRSAEERRAMYDELPEMIYKNAR